jgi:RecB family endonuclease NucS
MTLEEYKSWYIRDEGHWYVSKVKQYNTDTIQEFAKGLGVIASVINATPNTPLHDAYMRFLSIETEDPPAPSTQIYLNDKSVLFICLLLLQTGLIDSAHLEASNPKKFIQFSQIQKEFLEGKDYDFFIDKYSKAYLTTDLFIYYRNFKSWLGKFGFYGEYENKTAYITEMGFELILHQNDKATCSALFHHQIKKYQIWNPTIDDNYKEFQIRPYYLLLDVLLKIDSYFTKDEYVLFITKMRSHIPKDINDQIALLKQYRALNPEDKKLYIEEIKELDKKKFKKRKRTNFERIIDSSPKEIACYGYGGLVEQGKGRNIGTFVLTDETKATNELIEFNNSVKYLAFQNKLDWISHLGSKNGITNEQIVELYVSSGISLEDINLENEYVKDVLHEKIKEKEIEDYYVKNISEIDNNLTVITDPVYGRQFSTHIGPIDILCIDKVTNEYVVCELKRGHTSDETVGQILRYMGWVKKHLEPDSEKRVRGILIGSDFSEKIEYSFLGVQHPIIFDLITKHEHPYNDSNRPKK